MRRFILFALLAWTGLPFRCQSLEWLTDAHAALEKAKSENKIVLLDFTGSDWCGWCMKLKREVFDTAEFSGYAQTKLILVEVDFPHQKTLPFLQQQANVSLEREFHITGYPTLVLLSPERRMLGRLGYVQGGPNAFIARLDKVLTPGPSMTQRGATEEPTPGRTPVVFTPPPPQIPIHYENLALKAISGTKERRMVLINNANFMIGETAKVRVQDRVVLVCCKEIRDDSVLVTCDGKEMELKLTAH